VESHPDPVRGAVPVRFGPIGGPFQEIVAIFDWWPGEDHRYFRVRTGDGSEYILRHELATDTWRLDFFRHRNPSGVR